MASLCRVCTKLCKSTAHLQSCASDLLIVIGIMICHPLILPHLSTCATKKLHCTVQKALDQGKLYKVQTVVFVEGWMSHTGDQCSLCEHGRRDAKEGRPKTIKAAGGPLRLGTY